MPQFGFVSLFKNLHSSHSPPRYRDTGSVSIYQCHENPFPQQLNKSWPSRSFTTQHLDSNFNALWQQQAAAIRPAPLMQTSRLFETEKPLRSRADVASLGPSFLPKTASFTWTPTQPCSDLSPPSTSQLGCALVSTTSLFYPIVSW